LAPNQRNTTRSSKPVLDTAAWCLIIKWNGFRALLHHLRLAETCPPLLCGIISTAGTATSTPSAIALTCRYYLSEAGVPVQCPLQSITSVEPPGQPTGTTHALALLDQPLLGISQHADLSPASTGRAGRRACCLLARQTAIQELAGLKIFNASRFLLLAGVRGDRPTKGPEFGAHHALL
jgi:hypothetical protein